MGEALSGAVVTDALAGAVVVEAFPGVCVGKRLAGEVVTLAASCGKFVPESLSMPAGATVFRWDGVTEGAVDCVGCADSLSPPFFSSTGTQITKHPSPKSMPLSYSVRLRHPAPPMVAAIPASAVKMLTPMTQTRIMKKEADNSIHPPTWRNS